ncbi:MAG: hypothetical protein GX652_05445 [Burkholderiaceae bacterium]|nr:hypothetical protein [Burkholderiaceae bacterium]
MMIRMIKFKGKKESLPRFAELSEGTKAASASMDGLQAAYSVVNENGEGCVIGVWESLEKAEAAQATSDAIWANLAEHLEGPPEKTDYVHAVQLR